MTILELLLPDDAGSGWQERALCAQTDPEAFFPEKGGSTREAKRVCMSCDVRDECLEGALEREERFGIWGGLSERERRKVVRQRELAAGPQERVCGLAECEELLPADGPRIQKYCSDLHAHRDSARRTYAKRKRSA